VGAAAAAATAAAGNGTYISRFGRFSLSQLHRKNSHTFYTQRLLFDCAWAQSSYKR